jgi:hypothetical protein
MAKKLAEYNENPPSNNRAKLAVKEALGRPKRTLLRSRIKDPVDLQKEVRLHWILLLKNSKICCLVLQAC